MRKADFVRVSKQLMTLLFISIQLFAAFQLIVLLCDPQLYCCDSLEPPVCMLGKGQARINSKCTYRLSGNPTQIDMAVDVVSLLACLWFLYCSLYNTAFALVIYHHCYSAVSYYFTLPRGHRQTPNCAGGLLLHTQVPGCVRWTYIWINFVNNVKQTFLFAAASLARLVYFSFSKNPLEKTYRCMSR